MYTVITCLFFCVFPGYSVKSPVSAKNDEKSRSTGDAAKGTLGLVELKNCACHFG